jgi:CO dehydrogenase nickel-insertion accessory protein CooC1
MMTFDRILSSLASVLRSHENAIKPYFPILINRDVYGRVVLVLDSRHEQSIDLSPATSEFNLLVDEIFTMLAPHIGQADTFLLFEDRLDELLSGSQAFPLCDPEGNCIDHVHVIDRLAQESTWESIAGSYSRTPRVVFYSIKGGVGRSTALAACAWSLAASGQRVLVLDLDLESPGLSTSLLPQSRQPAYGITDWLVEDLVGNGEAVFEQMHASLSTPQRGELIVVPSHGFEPGEYVSKLGRVWMPGFTPEGHRQNWSERLQRLISALEQKHQPSIVLIDSRAGIDEVASACVTDLAARLIYLFAVDSLQTWRGYQMLFDHWRLHDVAPIIRKRLQVVGALIPTWSDGAFTQATHQLRENAYSLFSGSLYDEAWPEADEDADGFHSPPADLFNFDLPDLSAPHNPCAIGWNQAFAAIESLHDRLQSTDPDQIKLVFGSLLTDLQVIIGDNQ